MVDQHIFAGQKTVFRQLLKAIIYGMPLRDKVKARSDQELVGRFRQNLSRI
jgi:hypothetical protein